MLWIGLAAVASAPLYPQLFAQSSQYDWRYFLTWIEVGRRTLLWWAQVPLWNPYVCGGMPHLANPQSVVASPTMIFAVLFGTGLGTKLMVTFYLFTAFDGMHRLARKEGLSPLGAATAAILFGGGGWLAIRLSSGHINFAGAALFPYLVLAYRHALARWGWIVVIGIWSAWIVALGGTSTPPMAAVLLATLATVDAVKRKSVRPFAVLALGAACGLALGAARIFPAIEFAIDHPRRQWETDSNLWWQLIRNGWWWKGLEPVAGKRYWFHEYSYRMPFLAAPLAVLALYRRHLGRYWIVMIVGALIASGSAIPYGPWWALKHLPIFRDLRVPSRYSVMFAFALPLLCGAAIEELKKRFSSKILVAALVVMTVDAFAYDWFSFRNLFAANLYIAESTVPFHQTKGHWSSMMNVVFAGHGNIMCDEEAPLTRALTLDEGGVPQVRLEKPEQGRVVASTWTPNEITARVEMTQPGVLLVNSNWNEHWRTNDGTIVKHGPKVAMDKDGGRLAVQLQAGTHDVKLVYRPRSFVVGAWVSVCSWLLAIAYFVVGRFRPVQARQPPSIDTTSV